MDTQTIRGQDRQNLFSKSRQRRYVQGSLKGALSMAIRILGIFLIFTSICSAEESCKLVKWPYEIEKNREVLRASFSRISSDTLKSYFFYSIVHHIPKTPQDEIFTFLMKTERSQARKAALSLIYQQRFKIKSEKELCQLYNKAKNIEL